LAFAFQLKTEDDGKVYITGSSGVAAAWGFYYYLSQYCNCHVSWAGNQLNLPGELPMLPSGGVTVVANDRCLDNNFVLEIISALNYI